MLTPLARRTFVPRGETPVQKSWDRHDRISAISAITVSPERHRLGLYFELLEHNRNVHADDIVAFPRSLRRQIRRPLDIVWDRINIHDKSRVVRNFLTRNPSIQTRRLPAYAPELNPDEGVWNYTKFIRLCNFAASDIHNLRAAIQMDLEDLRRQKDLLAGFIKHSKLPLLGARIL